MVGVIMEVLILTADVTVQWAKPYQSRLPPQYYNRHFTDEEKTNKIITIVAPPGDDNVSEERNAVSSPAPIHSHVRVHASILTQGNKVEHTNRGDTTKTLVHNIMRSGYRAPKDAVIEGGARLEVFNGDQKHTLEEGDSLYVNGKLDAPLKFANEGSKDAEFLLFEMK